MSKWDNIIRAGQAGNIINQSLSGIGESLDRVMNRGTTLQERTARNFQLEDEQRKLANELRLKALINPETGIVPLQPGQQMGGDLQATGFDGFAFSKAARDAENQRLLNEAIEKNKAIWGVKANMPKVHSGLGVVTRTLPDGTTVYENILPSQGGGPAMPGTIAAQAQASAGLEEDKQAFRAGESEKDRASAKSLAEIQQESKIKLKGQETAAGLRDDIQQDKTIKDFTIIDGQFDLMKETMQEAQKTNNFLAVDQSLINVFNKMIAPDSVVMPSEYLRTANDQALFNRIAGIADKVLSGGVGLQPADRQALFELSQRFYGAAQKRYDERADVYKGIAKRNGVNIEDLGLREKNGASSVPATKNGNKYKLAQ